MNTEKDQSPEPVKDSPVEQKGFYCHDKDHDVSEEKCIFQCEACGGEKSVHVPVTQNTLWDEVLSILHPYFLKEDWSEILREFKWKYVISRTPESASPDPKGEIPEEIIGIVYDKIFIPTKNEPGGEYPSAVCDFDDDEQAWVPGDRFVKSIAGPVAIMTAAQYYALRSTIATLTKENESLIASVESLESKYHRAEEEAGQYRKALEGAKAALINMGHGDRFVTENITDTLAKYPSTNTKPTT